MKLNVRLIRKIIKHILAEPNRYYQADWVQTARPGSEIGDGQTFAKCGTAACIAGWAYLLSTKDADPHERSHVIMETAENNLGIDRDASRFDLFSGEPSYDWPAPFGRRYTKAKTPRGRARAAAQLL